MTTVTGEIAELEERLKQADLVFDPELLDELLVDDFSFTGQDGSVYTKEQILAAHRPAGARKFTRYETSELHIREVGEHAAVATVRVDLETQNVRVGLRFTRFWLKLDGRWRVAGGAAAELEHSHD